MYRRNSKCGHAIRMSAGVLSLVTDLFQMELHLMCSPFGLS